MRMRGSTTITLKTTLIITPEELLRKSLPRRMFTLPTTIINPTITREGLPRKPLPRHLREGTLKRMTYTTTITLPRKPLPR